jgi:hypothetical protein
MSRDTFSIRALEGARKVLADCLQLRRCEPVGVIWDETTEEVYRTLAKAADELGLVMLQCQVDLDYQAAFGSGPHAELDVKIRDVLQASCGILTCVSDRTTYGAFRHKLVKEGADRGKRLGHIPGADLNLLAYAVNIDYGPVVQRCDDLALALTLGRTATLSTYVLDAGGEAVEQHVLTLDLDSFDRSPITSTGIIAMDTWGNLPGGETFIAPIEDGADGTFVLNAAFKGHVLTPPRHLVMRFERGRLCATEGGGPESAATERIALEQIIDYAKSKGDSHWDNIAELGIGVNAGILQLTGNALFDEKLDGTAHIAIGANDAFGGKHASVIHEDFITWHPSLAIDGEPILDHGRSVFRPRYWRETLENPAAPQKFTAASRIKRTLHPHGEYGPRETLRIRRDVAAGRVCHYTVGDDETSRALWKVYSLIPANGAFSQVNGLAVKAGLTTEAMEAALSILARHQLIRVN